MQSLEKKRVLSTLQVGGLALLCAMLLPAGVEGGVESGGIVSVGDDDPLTEEVSYSRDVAPILRENCEVCHRPGALGPMSLQTYDEVRPWAPLINEQVKTRNMPPYHYDPDVGIQELKFDQRLTREEIETIAAWVEGGAIEGDRSELPPAATWPEPGQWRMGDFYGEPDLVVPSSPYTVPATGNDIWHRPLVPSGLTEDRCIKAIEVKPSVAGYPATHHANSTFQVQNENGEWVNGGRLTEYAIGKLGEVIPADACRVAPANSMVYWDIHYYPFGEEVADDVMEIGLWFHPDDEESRPEYIQTLANYHLRDHAGPGITTQLDMVIPPHSTLVTQGLHTWDTPVRLDSFQAHGHLRLAAKWMEVYDPATGVREVISSTPNFNPGWHISYMYEDHVAPLIPAGAVVILTALHDNTANNPWNPDPDQWVGRGSRTGDEMSHAWIAVTHLDQEGYERLLAERQAREDLTSDRED
jgi:hypothetical protein